MATTTSWISKRADRCGGEACIRDTRITVWGLVALRRQGASDEEIIEATGGLTPSDLEAAWDYEAANRGEIDQAIRDNEAGDEEFVE